MISQTKPNLALLVSKFLMPITSHEALENYLGKIFLPLSVIKAETREVIIPFVIFHKLMQLPLILSTHLFRVIKREQQCLNLSNFTKGVASFYIGTIEQRLEFLFSICDLNQNGRLAQEDVELILKHLHYYEYGNDNDNDNKEKGEKLYNVILKMIERLFNGKSSLNYSELKDRLEINSDLIVLLFIFLRKLMPFKEDSINWALKANMTSKSICNSNFCKGNCSIISYIPINEDKEQYVNECLEVLSESTEDLYDYITNRFNIELDYQALLSRKNSNHSMKELEQFEEDLNEVITKASSKDNEDNKGGVTDCNTQNGNGNNDESNMFLPKKRLSSFKLKLVKLASLPTSNTNHPNKITNMKSSCNVKSAIKSSLSLNKPFSSFISLSSSPSPLPSPSFSLSQSSSLSPSLNNPFKSNSIQGTMDIKNKSQLVCINTINKDLFIYTPNFSSVQIIHMNNFFITVSEKETSNSNCSDTNDNNSNDSITDTRLYSISIIPRYTSFLTAKTITCKYNESIVPFIQQIQHDINQRHIEEEYAFGDKIWNGDNSTIFKGKAISSSSNSTSKDIVAIKVISKKSLDDSNLEMIETEIEISRLMHNYPHENIIKTLDIYESDNYYFIINEYLADGTLTQYLKRKPMTSKTQFKLFLNQILKSIRFIHSFGIVHRDLKTDNILLLRNRNSNNSIQLKLNDFGLSKIIGFTDRANESCGSLSYTAPEILLKEPYYHKVDIWSLGVLSFYLWYNQLPFSDANNDMEVISAKIQQGLFEFPQQEECSDLIKQFIKLCLEVDVKLRPRIDDLLDW